MPRRGKCGRATALFLNLSEINRRLIGDRQHAVLALAIEQGVQPLQILRKSAVVFRQGIRGRQTAADKFFPVVSQRMIERGGSEISAEESGDPPILSFDTAAETLEVGAVFGENFGAETVDLRVTVAHIPDEEHLAVGAQNFAALRSEGRKIEPMKRLCGGDKIDRMLFKGRMFRRPAQRAEIFIPRQIFHGGAPHIVVGFHAVDQAALLQKQFGKDPRPAADVGNHGAGRKALRFIEHIDQTVRIGGATQLIIFRLPVKLLRIFHFSTAFPDLLYRKLSIRCYP